MRHLTLHTATVAVLEKILNAAIRMDTHTQRRLQEFHGKSITFHCSQPEITISMSIRDIIQLSPLDIENNDASVSGAYTQWLTLLRANDKAAALVNSALTIKGDSKLLIAISEIANNLDIDLEGQLAVLVGDVTAHNIGNFARHGRKLMQEKLNRANTVVNEFLREEARLSPSATEGEAFYKSLRLTEMKIDRLEAKLHQLRR